MLGTGKSQDVSSVGEKPTQQKRNKKTHKSNKLTKPQNNAKHTTKKPLKNDKTEQTNLTTTVYKIAFRNLRIILPSLIRIL